MKYTCLRLVSGTLALGLAFALAGTSVPALSLDPQDAYLVAYQKQRDDQDEARKQMQAGNQLSLREIEGLIVPKMEQAEGAQYLGPAYDAAAQAYRLKFIKNGRVMYVDVDARTGRIINRSK